MYIENLKCIFMAESRKAKNVNKHVSMRAHTHTHTVLSPQLRQRRFSPSSHTYCSQSKHLL